jgi:hypothetical protein
MHPAVGFPRQREDNVAQAHSGEHAGSTHRFMPIGDSRHTRPHTHLNSHALALVRPTRNPNMCVLACHTLIPIGIFLCTVSLALAAFKRCWSQPADTFTASVDVLSCALAMCALRAGWVCGVPFVSAGSLPYIALNCTSPARKTQSITRVYLRTRTFTRVIHTLAT